MLKNNNQALNEKIEEEKKKPVKKSIRPSSLNTYRPQSQVSKTQQSVIEKEQALEINSKLKK